MKELTLRLSEFGISGSVGPFDEINTYRLAKSLVHGKERIVAASAEKMAGKREQVLAMTSCLGGILILAERPVTSLLQLSSPLRRRFIPLGIWH